VLFEGFSNLVGSIFGLTDAIDKFSQERRDLGDAKLAYQDVVQQGVDTARQIEDIKRNESDPARQEYLIKRALEAQKRAEATAAAQVANAQANLDQAKQDQSFTGQLKEVGSNFFGGLAQDLFKGGFLNLFANAFGQLGTETNPMVVRPQSGLGGVGDAFSQIFGLTKDEPINKQAQSLSTTDQGAQVDEKATKSFLESSGLSALGSQIGDLFGPIGQEISGIFGQLLNVVKTLFTGGDDGSGGVLGILKLVTSVVGIFAGNYGAIAGVAQGAVEVSGAGGSGGAEGAGAIAGTSSFAGGGSVVGPGTSTSDSIPAFLSNGEYVLNAKTTSKIGKETLDMWNHHNRYPAKFASGGLVGNTRAAVRNRETLREDVANIKPANGPSSLKAILVDDQRRIADYINSPEGEKTLIAFVGRNRLPLRQNLQG